MSSKAFVIIQCIRPPFDQKVFDLHNESYEFLVETDLLQRLPKVTYREGEDYTLFMTRMPNSGDLCFYEINLARPRTLDAVQSMLADPPVPDDWEEFYN